MDHNSLASVKAAAQQYMSKETELHGLVNNAGIMSTPYQITKDGYESQFQTNHMAHWLFTNELIPTMLKTSLTVPTGTCRIVNISSIGHTMAPKCGIDFNDTSLPNESGMTRYGQSKLANTLHITMLNKTYGPDSRYAKSGQGEIWSSAVHPGLVESGLGGSAELPLWMKIAVPIAKFLGQSMDSDKGAWTSIYCVASADFKAENSGAYFQRIADPNGNRSDLAKDEKLAEKLDSWTAEKMAEMGLL